MIAGIVIALFMFFTLNSLIVDALTHNPDAGWFPAAVVAAWILWFTFRDHKVDRSRLLRPKAKVYSINCQEAFSRIYSILKETTYNYGDRWHIVTADVATNQIVADLRFTDEESSLHMGLGGQVHHGTTRAQRYLRCAIQLYAVDSGDTIIKFRFTPIVQGFNIWSCDSIIIDFQDSINLWLGPGTSEAEDPPAKSSGPPFWLIGITVVMLVFLTGNIQNTHHKATATNGF